MFKSLIFFYQIGHFMFLDVHIMYTKYDIKCHMVFYVNMVTFVYDTHE